MPSNSNSSWAIEYLHSPIGWLKISANEQALCAIDFADSPASNTGNALTRQTVSQLKEYFAGQRQQFSIPLAASGTPFQQQVWRALTQIVFGQTASYLDIAQAIDNPKAVRAVGAANGRNPIPIIVPCHRVIGRNGKLTGFTGGLDKKKWLLQHEQAAFIE